MRQFVFVATIFLMIFLISCVRGGSIPDYTCPDNQRIFRIAAQQNAHVEPWNGAAYSVEICFDDFFQGSYLGANPHNSNGNNYVLNLSSLTNAHVQVPLGIPVYYGDLACQVRTSCDGFGGAGGHESIALVTLSSQTNAHVSINSYPWKLCCYSPSIQTYPPECGNGRIEGSETCDDGNTDDDDGCSSVCETELPPDQLFCETYSSHEVYFSVGSGSSTRVVATCAEYGSIPNPSGGYSGDFRQDACEYDCVRVGDNAYANGVTATPVQAIGCAWTAGECVFNYQSLIGPICQVQEIDSGECLAGDTTRSVNIRVTSVPPGAATCDEGCGGQTECTREVPCGQVLELPFFSHWQLLATVAGVFVIYTFRIKKR